jgi:hypothetical protein
MRAIYRGGYERWIRKNIEKFYRKRKDKRKMEGKKVEYLQKGNAMAKDMHEEQLFGVLWEGGGGGHGYGFWTDTVYCWAPAFAVNIRVFTIQA